jgi:hypothetical protein
VPISTPVNNSGNDARPQGYQKPTLELELRPIDMAEPLQRIRAQREAEAWPVRGMHRMPLPLAQAAAA